MLSSLHTLARLQAFATGPSWCLCVLTQSGPGTFLPEAGHNMHVQPLKTHMASETAHFTSYSSGTGHTDMFCADLACNCRL